MAEFVLKYFIRLFVACSFVSTTAAVRCKICPDGVPIDGYCSKVGECSGDSVCYTSVVDEGFGFKRVTTGCMSRQVCRNNGVQVRRRQAGTQTCFDCCDSDLCNGQLCNTAPPSGFRECYGCDGVGSPEGCDTAKLCTADQYCMTEYRYTGTQSGTYRLDCESIAMCDKQEQYSSYFHKRGLDQGEEGPNSSFETFSTTAEGQLSANKPNVSAAVGRRYIDDPMAICLTCCKYPMCNNQENCVTNEKAPPPRTTAQTP